MELKDIREKLSEMINQIDSHLNPAPVETPVESEVAAIEPAPETEVIPEQELATEINNPEAEIPADRLAWDLEKWNKEDSNGLIELIKNDHSHYKKLKQDLTDLYNSTHKSYPIL